jgi:hypothetical protein
VLLFLVSLVVHGVAMAQMLSAAHGHSAAWEPAKAKLLAAVSSTHVLKCSTNKIVILQSSLPSDDRAELSDWVHTLRQIEYIQARLIKLRKPYIPLMWFVPSVAVSAVITSPVLYGALPFCDINAHSALIVALIQAPFYFIVTQRHAAIWSTVQDMAARSTQRIAGANLEPIP